MFRKAVKKAFPVVFWLLVWYVAARLLNQPILLVSPVDAVKRLAALSTTLPFWGRVGFTLSKILLGFFLSALLGIGLAVPAARFPFVKELLAPLTGAMKAVPVASFVILAFFWVGSEQLSVIISMLIGFPVIYAAALTAFSHLDQKLSEMSRVFRVPLWRRLRWVILPQVLPSLTSALGVAVGMCFKSGVAAEIIGIARGSIGESLYEAKMYLDTGDLFAWTLVIVLLSTLCEKVLRLLLKLAERGTRHCSNHFSN